MPEISIIVPTYNERANLLPLIASFEAAFSELDYEVVVVDDDSPDDTAALARSLAQSNPKVRVIQRIGRRGLASATVEGMLASSAPYMAVMDADMQHDEAILPVMLDKLKREGLDLVIGSRHVAGGSVGAFAKHRRAISQFGQRLSKIICRADVSDPMSGYFVVTREYFQEVAHSLSTLGFKILLDLIASSHRPVKLAEVGYTFRSRVHGASKLDVVVGLEYFQLLLDKLVGNWIPVSYITFSTVGVIGLVANILLVYLVLQLFKVDFTTGQAIGSLAIIALNFFLNNAFTFRTARLRGRRILLGLSLFYLACSIGLVFNLAAAKGFREYGVPWYWASTIGIVIGSVWNYWVTSLLIWKTTRSRTAKIQQAYDFAPLETATVEEVPALRSDSV